MLAAGQLNVEQATTLLKALGPSAAEAMSAGPVHLAPPAPPPSPPGPPPAARRAGGRPRFIRIHIESKGKGGSRDNVNLNVPFPLAKFALRFLPTEAKADLHAQGIDIAQLLEGINDDLPEGKLIDIESDKGDGADPTHITIEVI